MVFGQSKEVQQQLAELHELEKEIINRRNIEERILKEQIAENKKREYEINERMRKLSSPAKTTSVRTPLRIPTARTPTVRKTTSVHIPTARKTTSVRIPTVRTPAVRTPAVIEQPSPNVTEQDIDNLAEESLPPPYETNEMPYEIADEVAIEPYVEKVPDISYSPEEDLSYRK
jgi:hypothetical protein